MRESLRPVSAFSVLIQVLSQDQLTKLLGILPDLGTVGMRAYQAIDEALAMQRSEEIASTSASSSNSSRTRRPFSVKPQETMGDFAN